MAALLRPRYPGERDSRSSLLSSMLQSPPVDANRSSAPSAFAATTYESTAAKLARIEAAVYAQVRSSVGVGASGTEPSLGTADGGSHDGDGTVSFADQYLGDDGCVELCRVLHPFIARSSASPATASASSSAASASAGQLATITALDLRGNDISTVGARAIADVMRIATSIRRYADAVPSAL
jgi:hypothetical protein